MPGGECLRPDIARHLQQVCELHGLVALDAGDRRLAARVAVGEAVDDGCAEPLLVVEDEVRDPDLFRRSCRVGDIPSRRSRRHGASTVLHRKAEGLSRRRRTLPPPGGRP